MRLPKPPPGISETIDKGLPMPSYGAIVFCAVAAIVFFVSLAVAVFS